MADADEQSKELALKVARIFATAGCDRIVELDKDINKKKFYSTYQDRVETDAANVKFSLSSATADNPDRPSTKFFPLPFNRKKDYLITLFRPHFIAGPDACKVDVVQLSASEDLAIGYRLERGHRGNSDMHGYLHVQMADSFPHKDGNIVVDLPKGFSRAYPAYPVSSGVFYASLYSAFVAFAGMRRDWSGGIGDEFEKCRDYYDGSDFDDVAGRLKEICERLF